MLKAHNHHSHRAARHTNLPTYALQEPAIVVTAVVAVVVAIVAATMAAGLVFPMVQLQ